MSRVVYSFTDSLLGRLISAATDDGVILLEFCKPGHLERQLDSIRGWFPGPVVEGEHPHLQNLHHQLQEYFSQRVQQFNLPLVLRGTPFQLQVWQELQQIPYGTTISYFELARRLGSPRSCRAVGAANGRNPISIVIPCHRVIRSDGSLGGYGGEPWRKEKLLEMERA